MVLWLLAYLALGQVVAPALMAAAGLEREALSARGTAFLHLGLDAGEVALTLGILWRCLRHYRPRERGLFALRWDGGRWLLPLVLVGAITFPIVNWIAEASVAWFSGEDGEVWSEALEVTLAEGDWVTNGAYITVIALCAPIWEEAIFRGFLLASLQRSLPAPGAALLSALVFAVAHVRPSTFAPLLLLGLVFAALYQRSNNLLPPIVLHSAWNLYVLWRMLVS
jgi:membrane protease YdiL (CAAX protease family)